MTDGYSVVNCAVLARLEPIGLRDDVLPPTEYTSTLVARGNTMTVTMPTGLMAGITIIEDYEPVARTRTVVAKERDNEFDVLVAALAGTWNEDKKRSAGAEIGPFQPTMRGAIYNKFRDAANFAGYSPRVDDKANVYKVTLVKGESCSQAVFVALLIPQIKRTRVTTVATPATPKVSTTEHEGSGKSA